MLTLALETSTRFTSVALLSGDQVAQLAALPAGQRTAETILTTCRDLLNAESAKPADLGLLGVSIGPGSFTGLRIGVVVAKTLAYALSTPVVGVNSLRVTAHQALGEASAAASIVAVADAQRDQVYSQTFQANQSLRENQPAAIVDVDAWIETLPANALVTGTGLRRVGERLEAAQPLPAIADPANWTPQAPAVGMLALEQHQRGTSDNFWSLAPHYLRASAAEEKLEG